MARTRLIARLDVKGPNLIKGIHLEGLRVLGNPNAFAKHYYLEGIDEIIYMDAVASLYGRNHLIDVLKHTASEIFIPMTVGGGIQSVDDVRKLLAAGADKIAVNTAATKRPELLREISETFGAQCVVLSVEAKRRMETQGPAWEAYRDNGREKTGRNVLEWVEEAQSLGIGEILLTSVDQEGTRKGFDLALIQAVSKAVSVPLIASGGMGNPKHALDAVQSGADAVAMADVLHYKRYTLDAIRGAALEAGLDVRAFA